MLLYSSLYPSQLSCSKGQSVAIFPSFGVVLISIQGGVRDAVAAICSKLSTDSVDAQEKFPSEHAEEILRALLSLCSSHAERLKEKERQEALQGSAVSGAASRVSQLLQKIREERTAACPWLPFEILFPFLNFECAHALIDEL